MSLQPRFLGTLERSPIGLGLNVVGGSAGRGAFSGGIAPASSVGSNVSRVSYLNSALRIARAANSPATLSVVASQIRAAMAGVNNSAVQSYIAYFTNSQVPFATAKQYAQIAVGVAASVLRVTGVGAAPVGMGDVNTSDPTLIAAGVALAQDLVARGCQQTAQPTVTAFQNAYNAAGGTPALVVDGLYGGNTAGALQTSADPGGQMLAAFNGGAVTPGCVLPAGSGGGTTPAPAVVVTPASPTQTVTVGGSSLLPLAIAGVAGAGLIGWAIYAKKARRGGARRRGHIVPHHHRLARGHR
jgi:hypothetical protein